MKPSSRNPAYKNNNPRIAPTLFLYKPIKEIIPKPQNIHLQKIQFQLFQEEQFDLLQSNYPGLQITKGNFISDELLYIKNQLREAKEFLDIPDDSNQRYWFQVQEDVEIVENDGVLTTQECITQ